MPLLGPTPQLPAKMFGPRNAPVAAPVAGGVFADAAILLHRFLAATRAPSDHGVEMTDVKKTN